MFLRFFCPDINTKKFKNNIFRLNSTRAIDWCMNLLIWMRKKFRIDHVLQQLTKCAGGAL
jgi:hypothetical protein